VSGYKFKIIKDSVMISFINDTNEKRNMFDRNWSHYSILHRVFNFMRDRGFTIENDMKVPKSIRKNHFRGYKGELKFKADRYPRGFKIEFYQEINYENRHGGEYDFDKFEKMPYLVKLRWINETNKISKFLNKLGVKDDTKIDYKRAEDIIKRHFVECWHHPQENMEFNLSELDGKTADASYNNKDRDGNTIYNGEVKYFRHWDGRLWRGKVYYNLNNMWWVIVNEKEYRNIANFNLFDVTEEDFKVRRKVRDRKPKSYIDRKEKIKEASAKELLNELKNRGFRVKVSR